MQLRARSVSVTSILCTSAALVLTGCGSHKSSTGALSQCEGRAENLAAATVLKRAYDSGKLGTEQQVARFFPGRPRSSYLRADGTLRPLAEVKGDAHWDYLTWMNGHVGASQTPVGDAMFEARMRVRNNSPCDEITQ